MIGWTKPRKKCPEHGLVLRNEGGYSSKVNYCPACGQQLTIVSIPYLFQVYFHPALMIVPAILVFLFGLFMFLDIRGCVVENRRVSAFAAKQQEAEREQILLTMPLEWETIYAGMDAIYYRNEKWLALKEYFKERPEIQLPKMKAEHLKLFINMLGVDRQDDAFALITKHMRFGEEE